MPRPKGSKNRPPDVPTPGYSTYGVMAITSASESNLKHWTNIGLIKAAIDSGEGRGSSRRFSPLNVVEVALCKTLHDRQVPVSVKRGALNIFQAFHREAVAFIEEYTEAPLVTEPNHLALFPDRNIRLWCARNLVSGRPSATGEWIEPTKLPSSVMLSWMGHRRTHGAATDAQLAAYAAKPDHKPDQLVYESAMERALRVAEVWARIRTGPFNTGTFDSAWGHFMGLFIGDDWARVELDPPPALLRDLIGPSAIVIDLANIVFQVGLRRNTHGRVGGGRWELGLGAW